MRHSHLDVEVNITGNVAVIPQQAIRLIRLESDMEFLVLIATMKTVVQSANVIHDP